MKYEYHTVFLTSPRAKPAKYMAKNEYVIDGVQMARDVQATIENMAQQGWELFNCESIISTRYLQITFTEGYTLIFRKAM